MASRDEDRAVVCGENVQPVGDVGGVVLARLKRQIKISTEERGAEFGQEFFDRVAFGPETFGAEVARQARFVCGPMRLMPISALDAECRLSNYAASLAGSRDQRGFRRGRAALSERFEEREEFGRPQAIGWAWTRELTMLISDSDPPSLWAISLFSEFRNPSRQPALVAEGDTCMAQIRAARGDTFRTELMRLVKKTLNRSGSWKPSSIGLPLDQSHCGVTLYISVVELNR